MRSQRREMSLNGNLPLFPETRGKVSVCVCRHTCRLWLLQWAGKPEDEIIPMDSIFPTRREWISTALSRRHRVEPLSRLEKVWNYQLLLGVGEGANYKQVKCLSLRAQRFRDHECIMMTFCKLICFFFSGRHSCP